jgi:hypothetical protein
MKGRERNTRPADKIVTIKQIPIGCDVWLSNQTLDHQNEGIIVWIGVTWGTKITHRVKILLNVGFATDDL